MSAQNEVSSITEEPILLEGLSEELTKCLQLEEEFVWVEIPETSQDSARICNSNPHDALPSNILNVVQSECENASLEQEFSDESECDSSKRFPILDIEFYDTEYEDLCQKNKGNLFKPSKLKYPMPYFLKVRERGVYRTEKRQNCNKNKEKFNHDMYTNDFLPAMKFDESTTAVLKLLVKNRYLGQYTGVVGTGKNSIVIHALVSRRVCTTMPFYNAVKIYKTSKNEERNRIIYRQVQREFEHLSILRRYSSLRFQSPWARKAKENVIVMEFVGFDEKVAQSIADLPCDKDQTKYNCIIEYMDKCYNLACLVHGNLSSRKILYWLERPWFVGWSHSVKRGHPQALTKLMKDCHFVTEFYKKRGLNVKSPLDVFKQITMQEKPSDKLLAIIQDKDLYDKYKTNPNRDRRNTSSVKPTNKRFK